MASIISAGTTSATALNMSADTTGILSLASNNGTVALTIATNGNVSVVNQFTAPTGIIGITTTGGGYGLRVQADSANTYASIQFTNFAGDTDWSYLRSYSQNTLSLLASSGGSGVSVGIGTTTPNSSYSLDTTGTIRSRADIYSGFVSGSQEGLWLSRNNYTAPAIQGLTSAGNGGTMLINPAGGAVTIGSNSGTLRGINLNSSEICTAVANTNTFLNFSDAAGSNGFNYSYNIRGLGSGGTVQVNLSSFNALAASVFNGSNTATWNVTSDQRLKKNIVDNSEGLAKISQIRVRNFEYRVAEEITDFPDEEYIAVQREGIQVGVIAQELRTVLPEFVYEQKNGALALSTDNLIWYMVNAIKELNAKVTALEEQVLNLGVK
jgi:hypothetical protein